MNKLVILLFFFGVFEQVFSQKADRSPQKTVKAENKVTREQAKDEKVDELVIFEDYRRTTIDADGSKTIAVKFTEVSPSQFVQADQEQNRISLSSMIWTKEDLLIYIESLNQKRTAVSQNYEQHAMALQNGWYAFLDSVILEARELLAKL
jgi:hypothetical protein